MIGSVDIRLGTNQWVSGPMNGTHYNAGDHVNGKETVNKDNLTLKNLATSFTCLAHTPFLEEGTPSPIYGID